MTTNSIAQIIVYFLLILSITKPLGVYMACVYEGKRTCLHPIFAKGESFLYRVIRVKPDEGMTWLEYALAMLIFSVVGIIFTYVLLRAQQFLPLNPSQLGAKEVSPDLAFNTAISFATNTNWQSYSPETTVSYFSNMLSLAIHNWMSAAVGMAIAIAVTRGFSLSGEKRIGNFWVDVVRSTLYVLFPISFFAAIIFVGLGVPQNFQPYQSIQTLEGATQVIPQGPVASQEAIKMLGTNGGGFFNANSAHPYENPNPLSNLLQMVLIFAIPSALTYTFGRFVGNQRQGWVLFAAMSLLFLGGATTAVYFEQKGTPYLQNAGVEQGATELQTGGNMEGKETRFDITSSALFATITTDASCGAVNAMHDSFTPIGGLVLLFNMLTGEVIFGGVGAGLYGMLMFAVLTVFIAGLMVGRTPEYLGKKIQRFEVQMAMLAVLVPAASILLFTAFALNFDLPNSSSWNQVGNTTAFLGSPRNNLYNTGAHGFSEMLYAFTSGAANNGSAFAGLSANTPFFNVLLGIAIFLGRFFMILPLLALAGNLATAPRIPPTRGTFPTDNFTFVGLLVGVVIIVGALTYFPALALGPIVEQLQMMQH